MFEIEGFKVIHENYEYIAVVSPRHDFISIYSNEKLVRTLHSRWEIEDDPHARAIMEAYKAIYMKGNV